MADLGDGRDLPEQAQGVSGVYVTTKDAYTLTDGPTYFMANDVTKIARFCIQQAAIPPSVMKKASLLRKS